MGNLQVGAHSGIKLAVLRFLARRLYSYPGSGLPRLAEKIRRYVAQKALKEGLLREVWIDDFRGYLRFSCDLSEHMGSQIFFRGAYSGDQLDLLSRLLPEDGVFVDAGANQGEFSVYAASLVPRGRVHSFEPMPDVRECLDRNVQANRFQNVEINGFGLSDKAEDDIPLYGGSERFTDGTENCGLPTLYSVEGKAHAVARISLRTLDSCLPDATRVDVIKIDVEGAEWFVLKGAEQIIRKARPFIIFEANEETCRAAGYTVAVLCEWLTERRYFLARIGGGGELSPVQNSRAFCNILAWPEERASKVPDISA